MTENIIVTLRSTRTKFIVLNIEVNNCRNLLLWKISWNWLIHDKIANLFSRNILKRNKISFFHAQRGTLHTVEFTKFLYHEFLKNFRENNFFSKEFTIELISRNNSQVILALCSVCRKTRNSLSLPKFFRQINLKFFSKTLIWRKICEITVAVKFLHLYRGDTHSPFSPSNQHFY